MIMRFTPWVSHPLIVSPRFPGKILFEKKNSFNFAIVSQKKNMKEVQGLQKVALKLRYSLKLASNPYNLKIHIQSHDLIG